MNKNNKIEKQLTEVELELMQILWRIGQGSVSEVIEQLPPSRKLAYTSVSTILRILEKKGILQAQKEGRGHIYVPQLPAEDFEAATVQRVVEKVFHGEPSALVRQLLGSIEINDSELEKIRNLLNKHEASQ
jgi:predicted transcriptional regulator